MVPSNGLSTILLILDMAPEAQTTAPQGHCPGISLFPSAERLNCPFLARKRSGETIAFPPLVGGRPDILQRGQIDTIDPKGDTANTVFSVNEISLESVKLRVTATAEIVGEESS
jgi:hypothetical protein